VIPECIGNLTKLAGFGVEENNLAGYFCAYLIQRHIPESIADLRNLVYLSLSFESSSNLFTGRLPLRMGEMELLETLYVGVSTLSGPLPEFYKAQNLFKCDFSPADYCRLWDVPSSASSSRSNCDFKKVPMCNSDCMVLYEWIDKSPGRCCADPRISCDQEERIITM
jgi:hypothetical protein